MKDVLWYSIRVFVPILTLSRVLMSQSGPPDCAVQQAVFPFVCVAPLPFPGTIIDPGPSTIGPAFENPTLVAYWGYANKCSGPVTFPQGNSNFFFPGDPLIGQPTVFEPGIHYRVHVVQWQLTPGQPSLTWLLGNNTATATQAIQMYCQNPTGLIWKGTWSATKSYFANDVVSYNGSRWMAKKPEYIPLFPSDLSGMNIGITPVEGDYWTMLAGQGPQGIPGSQGPPGPTGPSGVASITTVTVPTTTVTATAACNTNQVLISGGGTCTVPNTNSISGRIASSGPAGNNNWTVTCSAGQATAVALCAAK